MTTKTAAPKKAAPKAAAPRARHVAREVRSKLAEAAEALKEVAVNAAGTGLAAATDVVVRTLANEAAPEPPAGAAPARRPKLKSAKRATPAKQAKAAAPPKTRPKAAKAPGGKKAAKPA